MAAHYRPAPILLAARLPQTLEICEAAGVAALLDVMEQMPAAAGLILPALDKEGVEIPRPANTTTGFFNQPADHIVNQPAIRSCSRR